MRLNISDPAVHQEGVGTSDEAAHSGTSPCTCSTWQPGYASEQEARKHSTPFPSWVSPLIYTSNDLHHRTAPAKLLTTRTSSVPVNVLVM